MNNPIVETDLGVILSQINNKLDAISTDVTELKLGQTRLIGKVNSVDERLTGKIEILDEKLTGQIKSVDERLTGEIKSVNSTLQQIDKRVGNQEFLNRGIFVGLLLTLLGGIANWLGWMPQH